MATWLVHLRIADRILEMLPLPRREFLAGNIAPDCGFPNGNGFDPPTEVTHWTKSGRKRDCDYIGFANAMLPLAKDEGERALILGYYSHLVTDVLWTRDIDEPAKRRFPELFRDHREEYYRLVKADWYDNDAAFLAKHPEFPVLTELSEIRCECAAFPYYKRDNINAQIINIAEFYRERQYNGREFVYITSPQVDEFVEIATGEIIRLLRGLK